MGPTGSGTHGGIWWIWGGIGLVVAMTLVGHFGPGWPLAAALGLTSALLALAVIDLQSGRLPDALTLPLLWSGLGVNLTGLFVALESAVLGAMAGYLLLRGTGAVYHRLTGHAGLGRGDAKLVAAIGAWLGSASLPSVLLIAAGLHTLVVGSHVLATGRGWRTPRPAGPAFALAAWFGLVGGPYLPTWAVPASL